MKLSIVAGATSQSINVFVRNSTSTTGGGLTGLAYNTSGLTAYYSFAGANAGSVAITLVTLASVGAAYSSGGFIAIDGTNMPGWYRLDLPNAVLAASKGRSVSLHLQGASNMAPLPIEIQLTGWDNQNAVNGGMSALPSVASGSAGSIPTTGTGSNQIAVSGGAVTVGTNNDKTGYSLTQAFPINFSSLSVDPSGRVLLQPTQTGVTIPTVTTAGSVTGSVGSVAGNVSGSVASVVGNVGGSVASVTGAVGSVTGLTPATITSAVWQDLTSSSDFTTASSIGKLLSSLSLDGSGRVLLQPTQTGVTIPTVTTVGSVSGSVASVTGAVTVGTNNDKTGYSLTQAFPTNFSSLSIDVNGRVDLGKILGTASAGVAGYVGIDWSHINAPTTTQGLTGTTIASTQTVASVSGAVGSVTGNVGGNVVGSVASVTGSVASVTGNVGGNVAGSVGSVTGLTNASIATAVWTDSTSSDFTTAGTPGKILVNQLGGTLGAGTSVFTSAALANAPSGGSGGATAAQIATAVWEDLITGGDFGTTGSIGKLLSSLALDASGRVLLQPTQTGVTIPTVTSVGSVSGSVGSVTGNVGGSVASVTGSVASVTSTVSANVTTIAGQTVTGSGAITFPAGTVASTTNITAGTIATVTNLTNLPTAPANWLTASSIAAGALNGKGDWLLSSGYTAPNNAGIASIVSKLPVNGIADETLVINTTNAILSAVGTPMQAGNVTVGGYASGEDPATLLSTAFGSIAANVWANVLETDGTHLTAAQLMRGVSSTLLGSSTGVGTNAEAYTAAGGTTVRVTPNADVNGNRTTPTLNL